MRRAAMLFRGRPTVSRQGIAFNQSSPAELCVSKRRGRHTGYRRFATAAKAIHYAVEELRRSRSLMAWMQVGNERFTKEEINRLYDDGDYPLRTRLFRALGLTKKETSMTVSGSQETRPDIAPLNAEDLPEADPGTTFEPQVIAV